MATDIAGVFDLDATLSTVSGRTALAQALLRRLTTVTGSLPGNASYGYDLHGLIGSTVPASVVEQNVRAQAVQEEEVEDARATVTFDRANSTARVELRVLDSEGPFTLTVEASALGISAFIDGTLFVQAA